jgi:transglutaminase-like putative cysteine protease
MTMRITVEHTTRYGFVTDATYSIQSLRLTPPGFDGQKLVTWEIACTPDADMTPTRDAFGNILHLMTVEGPHRDIAITARGAVDVEDRHGVVQGLADSVPLRVFLRRTALTAPDGEITALAGDPPAGNTLAWLHGLMERIRDRVDYRTGVTDTATTATEALRSGNGVCQDHAHIFIAAARIATIPARYVTGYLLTDGETVAEAHHAWAEAWVDGLGWVGFDVANRVCPTDRYVRMCAALDAQGAAPIRGSRRGGGAEELAVEVIVQQQSAQQ